MCHAVAAALVATRRLPLSGGLTRDRSRLAAADEHADQPRQRRVVLREHMLTVHARVGWRAKDWRSVHARLRGHMLPSACTAAQTIRAH